MGTNETGTTAHPDAAAGTAAAGRSTGIREEILSRLDIAATYREMGVKLNGQTPTADGWLSVHAAGREDKNPSASINVKTGYYKDHTTGKSLSLFDFAAKYGGHGDWRRARAFFAEKVGLRNGAKGNGRGKPSGNGQSGGVPLADADTLHAAYSALLDCLTLSDDHRAKLCARGLSDEQIDARRYCSYPMNGRDRARLFMLAAVGSKADGVPGMGRRSLYGPEGLLIPCRDTQGRIVALCIRRDAAGKGPKYVWLSSAQHGGPSPGAPCHVPADIRQPVPRVRIAEGTLKSDVAYSLSGLATIGVAGVGNLKTLVDTLKQLGAETAVLSFDSDAAENLAVATALQKAHKLLVAAGFQVEMERWAAEDGKGIDDLLAAGKVPDLLTGEDVAAEIKTIAQQAGAELLGIKGDGEENEPSLVAVVAEDILKTERFAQDGGGKLYRYAGGVYKPRAEEVIRQHAKRFCVVNELTKKWSIRFSKEVIEFIRVDSPILWERPPVEIVNVQNGLLRVIGDKRKLLPHSPDHLSPIQIPVAFNPAEECPNIDRFVSTTFPADAHDLAWEMVGWLMTPTTWLKKAVLLTGDGDNGKSVWLSLIVRFIGRQNVSTVSLHELEANKFKKARLVGKLANICADLPSEHLAGTSVFKQLTGGDTVEAERKFQEGFDVDLYARLIFSANHPPRSADSSGAFFRRWLVVPFDRTFAPEEQIPRDVLDAQLQDPAELSGLLNRALDGLARVQHQRGFSEPESVQAAWRDFHATTDPLAVWLDRYTLDAPELVCPGAVLRTAYNAAAEREGRPGLTDTAFGRAVRKQRPNVDYKQRTVSGRLQWCWLGIGLAGDDSRGSQGSQGFPSLFQSHAREPGEEG